MHAGFPHIRTEVSQFFNVGALQGLGASSLFHLEQVEGRALAMAMKEALQLGFGALLMLPGGQDFFKEHFVIADPKAPDGVRHYQGRFLIRTKKPGDDMNLFFQFCPNPQSLYVGFGRFKTLNPLATALEARVLSEAQADAMEESGDQVDLVIRFRDIPSILSLFGRSNVDIVGLLLENLVQLTGNVGHLFKLGAVGKGVEERVAALST